MGPGATRQYRTTATGLHLYAPQTQSWLQYEIRERADADANSSEFSVNVRAHSTETDGTTSFAETIGVGPGETTGGAQLPGMIRFARLENTTVQPTEMGNYSDSTIGYSISYPAAWDTSEFEGEREFRPADQPSLPTGEPTFAVAISLQNGSYDAIDGAVDDNIAGRDAKRSEVMTEGGEHRVVYQIDWDAQKFLRVAIIASTPDLWNKYGGFGEQMAHSIEKLAS
jgi:hypothetical protein